MFKISDTIRRTEAVDGGIRKIWNGSSQLLHAEQAGSKIQVLVIGQQPVAFLRPAIRSNKPDLPKLRTWVRLLLSAPCKYYWVDNVISQLSGTPGVREILFDSRIKCRGIAPRSPLPRESSPVA